MSSKEFEETFIEYVNQGLVVKSKRPTPEKFVRMNIGKKVLNVHINAIPFMEEIEKRVKSGKLMTRTMIESHYNMSLSYITRLVKKGEWNEYHFAGSFYLYFKNE